VLAAACSSERDHGDQQDFAASKSAWIAIADAGQSGRIKKAKSEQRRHRNTAQIMSGRT